MKDNWKYIIYFLGCVFFGYAYNLALNNEKLMLAGYKGMFCIILTLAIVLMIYFFIDENKKNRVLFWGIIICLITSVLTNFFVVDSFGPDYTHDSKSSFEYSYDQGDREMVKTGYTYKQYYKELRPMYFDLLEGKELFIDDHLVDDHRLMHIGDIGADVYNLNIQNEEQFNSYVENNQHQIVTHKDFKNSDELMLIYTGDAFEYSNIIIIVEYDGIIYMIPNEVVEINIEKSSKTLVYHDWKEAKYKQVNLELQNDSTISRIMPQTTSFSMIWYLLFIFITGFLLLIPMMRYINEVLNLTIILSFVVGAAFQVLLILLMGVLGLPISLTMTLIIEGIIIIGWNIFAHVHKPEFCKQELKISTFIFISTIMGIVMYWSLFPKVYMGNDSFLNIYIGKQISRLGTFDQSMGHMLMFSLINPLWQTLGNFFGVLLNYAIQPVLVMIGGVSLSYLEYKNLTDNGLSKFFACIIGSIIYIAIFTVPQSIINATWIMNNLAIGIMYGISVSLINRYMLTKNEAYIPVAYLLFLLSGLARIEGAVFAVVYLVFIYMSDLSRKHKLTFQLSFTALYIGFNIFNYFTVDLMKDGFWSFEKSLLIALLLISMSLVVYFDNVINKK